MPDPDDEVTIGFGDWRVEVVRQDGVDRVRVTINEVNEDSASTFSVTLPTEAAHGIGTALVHTAAQFDDD